jgi:hypothetical protein
MGSPVTWLLNFEADEELSLGGTFTPAASLARRMQALVAANSKHFLGPDDCLLGSESRGMAARMWCPTPTAVERVRAAGAELPGVPDVAVLRKANSREFCAGLKETLPGAFFARDLGELQSGLDSNTSPTGWLLKRNFGTSGRGQKALLEETPDAKLSAWIRSSWRNGGLRVEPLLKIDQEFVLHGHLTGEGQWHLADVCVQICDERGAWQQTRRVLDGELTPGENQAFLASGEDCIRALAEIGYFGPFGIDAFRWIDSAGVPHFQSRSEINARYTLGWTIGFHSNRVDL